MRNTDKSIFESLTDLCFADHYPHRVLVLRSQSVPHSEETPWHHHQKAQLVLPLTGVVTSFIDDKMWLVPPRCAVWIPSNVMHRNQISPNADVCMLFVDGADLSLPDAACTLTVTPFVRELILHLHTRQDYEKTDPATDRLVDVLLDQLIQLEREEFDFPIPDEPILNRLLPIQTISEELGYDSVSAFITFFKKALGKSPRQYRIERWGKE